MNIPKPPLPKFAHIFWKVRKVEGEYEGRSWNWRNRHISIEAKGVVEEDIKGVEATDLNSGGETRSMRQLWTGATGLVRHCGVRMSWYLDLKGKGFVYSIVYNFVSCYNMWERMLTLSLDWWMGGEERDCGVCWSEWCTVSLVCECEGLGEWVIVIVEKVRPGKQVIWIGYGLGHISSQATFRIGSLWIIWVSVWVD